MQGLVYNGKTAQYCENLPVPTPKKGESLVRITLAAICNTDREIMRGYKPDFTGVMGHEFVGVVEQSDDETLIGKRVVGELNEGCGTCLYCKTGRENHCNNRKVIGISQRDGCFAQYMIIATKLLHLVPNNVTDAQAVCTEPLAAALQILQMVHIQPNAEVCVIGDGRLSFMIAQVLSLTGANVYVLGRHAEKLAMFAPFATPCTQTDKTFEVVVDACGSPTGLASAATLVRKGGTIVMKSTYAGNASINLSQFVVNEVTLVGSRCGPFAPALRYLQRGLITLPDIQFYPLQQWQQAFASTAFKVGFQL